jgi:hypothetical protein
MSEDTLYNVVITDTKKEYLILCVGTSTAIYGNKELLTKKLEFSVDEINYLEGFGHNVLMDLTDALEFLEKNGFKYERDINRPLFKSCLSIYSR